MTLKSIIKCPRCKGNMKIVNFNPNNVKAGYTRKCIIEGCEYEMSSQHFSNLPMGNLIGIDKNERTDN